MLSHQSEDGPEKDEDGGGGVDSVHDSLLSVPQLTGSTWLSQTFIAPRAPRPPVKPRPEQEGGSVFGQQ